MTLKFFTQLLSKEISLDAYPIFKQQIYQILLLILLSIFLFTMFYTFLSSKINKNALKLIFIIELLTLLISLMFLLITDYYMISYGQIFVLFILTISALEAAIGLAFIYLYFRLWRTTTLLKMNKLKD